MKTGKSLQEFALEIERQAKTKLDYKAPVGLLEVTTDTDVLETEGEEPKTVERPLLRLENVADYGVGHNAHRQLGEYLNIPAGFYDVLKGDLTVRDPFNKKASLYEAVVNGLLRAKPEDDLRLVRTLDGTARAVLSDRFRPIDHDEIFTRMMPVLAEVKGLDLAQSSMEITDNRLYMKIVDGNKPKPAPGSHDKMDVLFRGAVITNSEVGLGSFAIQPMIYHQICSNGLIITTMGKRKYHTGGTGNGNGGGDIWQYMQDDTIRARNEATVLEMRDMLTRCLSDDFFDGIVDNIHGAHDTKVAPANAEKVIENVTNLFKLSKDDRNGVFGRFIEGGNLSVWGVIEAMTRHAQDVESYDHSTEIEMQAGSLLALPKHDITRLVAGDLN